MQNRAIRKLFIILSVTVLLAGVAALVGAEKSPWTKRDKAFFADENTLAFVRPGLVVDLMGAKIEQDGTIVARVKFTDPMGLPLDREGIYTPGVIVGRWTAAYIPAGQSQYRAYTTAVQTSPITGVSAEQASNDRGGVWAKVADGEYTYTFATKVPSGYDRTVTHTVSISASRDLTTWNLGTNLAEKTFNWVPNGSPVTVTRDVVRTATCNRCHDGLQLHGNTGRTTVQGCVMCHQPQSTDPDTGNTVDFKVMIHKIHYGEALPSVVAGKPYKIIGYRQSVHDFSHIVDPADVRRCNVCHADNTGAAQHDVWLTKPSRAACGSCHDNVNFATGENHLNLPQTSDNLCTTCHIPQGELEFDLSIKGAHTIPEESNQLKGTVVELKNVTNHTAGEKPTVEFTVKDKKGNPLIAADLDRLLLGLDGPTTDYPMEPIREDARSAAGGANGSYTYTFKAAIPADATGSWSVSVESRQTVKIYPGTKIERTVRDASMNPVLAFSVDGSPVQPRRLVVSRDKCNSCHADLSLHGNNRKSTEYCVMCHNPNNTDKDVRPADQMPAEAIDFRTMIHRIHTGENLHRVTDGGKYIIYGYRGSLHDYSDVGFPGKRNDCSMCHVNNSYQLPLGRKLLKVTDPRGWLNPVGPEAAACLGCHDSIQSASHALANTTLLAESCSTCHGPKKDFSVDRVHAK